jgi:predicted transcriptional regulator
LYNFLVIFRIKFSKAFGTMRGYSYVSLDQKLMIVELRKKDKTQRQIATLVGCTQAAVCKILARSLQPNGLEIRPKSGRKRVTTDKEDRLFLREYMKDRKKSAEDLATMMQVATPQETTVPRPPVSVDTWRRRLKEAGLRNYTMKKKVALNDRHRKLRFAFCQRYKDWLVEDWRTVIFSDECNVDAEPAGGLRTVWRKPAEKNAAFAIQQVFYYHFGSS